MIILIVKSIQINKIEVIVCNIKITTFYKINMKVYMILITKNKPFNFFCRLYVPANLRNGWTGLSLADHLRSNVGYFYYYYYRSMPKLSLTKPFIYISSTHYSSTRKMNHQRIFFDQPTFLGHRFFSKEGTKRIKEFL